MTYGFEATMFLENGPAVHAQRARFARRSAQAWRTLDEKRRLQLIERALTGAANDQHGDGLPIAL